MKIAEVKKMDNGVSNITIEGRITRVLKPRESQYGWSQFLVLKDDTGEMGSNINIENEEAKYQGGEYIQVKGKVSHYVKNDKPNVSLNGNVIDEITKVEDVSQEKPTTQPISQPKTTQKEYTKDDYWRDKTAREVDNNKCIVRECAIKAATEINVGRMTTAKPMVDSEYFELANEIVEYIYKDQKKLPQPTNAEITNMAEESLKEFGGTVKENPYLPEGYKENVEKDLKIARAKELVKNPHLADPVDDTMATVKQKKQIYGYINEEGKKIGGMVDSQYIKKDEVKNMIKADKLTKAQGIKYWDYWYGKDEELGERDKRELAAKEKDNPFVTARQPIEKRDPEDDASLNKDLLLEKIQRLRKKQYLTDDTKFAEAMECNANFDRWTEKDLERLIEKLEMYNPLR